MDAEREVLSSASANIWLIDGSAISEPRPDHTEDSWRQPGAHQVHHGPEVVGVQNQLLVNIVLGELCPQVLQQCQHAVDSTCSHSVSAKNLTWDGSWNSDSIQPIGGRAYALAEALVDVVAQARERHATAGSEYGGRLGLPRASLLKADGSMADGTITDLGIALAAPERGFRGGQAFDRR